METVLIVSLVVDIVMAVWVLGLATYLFNKDKRYDRELNAIKEVVEMNSALIANRSNHNDTWS